MKFIKKAKIAKTGFSAKFTSGLETKSRDTAIFFLMMQDKDATPSEILGFINIGKMVDPSHDWDEIERIAASFAKPEGKQP